MKTVTKVALLVLVSAGVMASMAHLFWPGGLPALIERLTPGPSAQPTPPNATRPGESPPLARPSGTDELRDAESAYDGGDFDRAVQLFLQARADVGADAQDRVARGLDKAILAWALTIGPRVDVTAPEAVDAEMARLQAEAETAPSEKAWYDAAMFAASTGRWRKLKHLTQQALDCAIPGGPVDQRLKQGLAVAGPRTKPLKDAMIRTGLLEPEDPVAAAEGSHSASSPAAATPRKKEIYTPGGSFKAETKAKLASAVDLEKRGTAEYELSGPDNPQRKQHRKAALDLLKQARDIYEAAQEEDPDSLDLTRRLGVVLEMYSHLRKESTLGE